MIFKFFYVFFCVFSGILHVPINVPALGVSLNEDNVDTNRELMAHGFSNMLSGLVGSVQSMCIGRDRYEKFVAV